MLTKISGRKNLSKKRPTFFSKKKERAGNGFRFKITESDEN